MLDHLELRMLAFGHATLFAIEFFIGGINWAMY